MSAALEWDEFLWTTPEGAELTFTRLSPSREFPFGGLAIRMPDGKDFPLARVKAIEGGPDGVFVRPARGKRVRLAPAGPASHVWSATWPNGHAAWMA